MDLGIGAKGFCRDILSLTHLVVQPSGLGFQFHPLNVQRTLSIVQALPRGRSTIDMVKFPFLCEDVSQAPELA